MYKYALLNYLSSFHVDFTIGQIELQNNGSDGIVEGPVDTVVHDTPIEHLIPSLNEHPAVPPPEDEWAFLPQTTTK
jgi:hypothetical protein